MSSDASESTGGVGDITNILGSGQVRVLQKVSEAELAHETYHRSVKRHCQSNVGEQEDVSSDAAVAEMLLDLCHSPGSSPRSVFPSEVIDEQPLSSECGEVDIVETADQGRGRRLRSCRQDHDWNQEDSEDEVEASPKSRKRGRAEKGSKRIPGRCKCGKRVSAAHPPCKSELMLLCERFRDQFGHLSEDGEPSRIHLNECATALGVPRRRLYDITIVYEAAEVVKRTGKLSYVWRGTAHLPELVEQLKREEENQEPVGDRRGSTLLPATQERQTTHSLWTLSRKFIRLLLTTEGPTQLTEAAKHLIGESGKGSKRQQTQLTVERRLYDIGSILSTLDLICRTYVEGKRQPAFSWNWSRKAETCTVKPMSASPPAHLSQLQPGEGKLSLARIPVPESDLEAPDMKRKGSATDSNESAESSLAWRNSWSSAASVTVSARPGLCRPMPLSLGWTLPSLSQVLPPSMRMGLGDLSPTGLSSPCLHPTFSRFTLAGEASISSSGWPVLCKPTPVPSGKLSEPQRSLSTVQPAPLK